VTIRLLARLLALPIVFASLNVAACPTSINSPVSSSPAVQTAAAPTGEVQVADEIIRRLRRLGLNFNRARIPRPYDPEGELC